MSEEYDWMEEARELAAQCWCDPETSSIEMDAALCESVAKRIAVWMQTAVHNQQNTDYYRGLLENCGEIIGDLAYIADDGTKSEDVLCAKIPGLIKYMRVMLDEFSCAVNVPIKPGADDE